MKKFLFTMGCAALVLASCTDDALENGGSNPRPDTPEMDANMITLTALDPTSQAGRIHMVPQTRGVKSERLNFVASIDNPEVSGDERNWSVTSLLIEGNTCFVTWHSDYQADGSPAKVWGGAFDVLNLTNIGDKKVEIDVGHTYITEAVKFNHVLRSGEYFYLSGGHYDKGAVIARIASGNLAALSENTYASCIGFPGTSVNAVAKDANGLVAVSGFRGGYGYFDGTLETWFEYGGVDENNQDIKIEKDDYDFYNYDDESANEWIKEVYGYGKDFGGKYVAVDEENKAYVLRSLGANGLEILDAKSGNAVVESNATLLSETKQAEEYDPETGWEDLSQADHPEYLGKHVMVIKDSRYAYVGAGQSGLRVYDLMSGGEIIWADQTDAPEGETNYGPNTTGLCIDGNFLYAATDMGLRIYKFLEGGKLELYAFEVESYDETTGKPTTNDAAKTDTKTRHSCNFVAVQTQGDAKYVYVAYGQSGIRVYKFEPNAEASDGE